MYNKVDIHTCVSINHSVCVCVFVSCLVVSDSANPWTVARQASLFMEFSRQEYRSGLLFPSPGNLPNPGIEPRSPALQEDSLPSEPPGKPYPSLSLPRYFIYNLCNCRVLFKTRKLTIIHIIKQLQTLLDFLWFSLNVLFLCQNPTLHSVSIISSNL